jgi:LysM repeat protein
MWGKTKGASTYTRSTKSGKNPSTYKVVDGDTLSEIATRFKTTVKNLQNLNHLVNPDKLVLVRC